MAALCQFTTCKSENNCTTESKQTMAAHGNHHHRNFYVHPIHQFTAAQTALSLKFSLHRTRDGCKRKEKEKKQQQLNNSPCPRIDPRS
jgi:hypothetical protein